MQTSMVFNQMKWPNAGDGDECWLVSTIQCANMVAPWLRLIGTDVGRKAAANPDKPGPTGGSLMDTVQVCETLWPRYFKDQLAVLKDVSWETFSRHVNRGVPVSVSTVSAKLPTRLQFGFGGLHRISLAKGTGGKWLVFNPLAPVYSRPVPVTPLEVKAAVMAYGRQRTGTSGAWAVVFPTAEHCAGLYFGQVDPTPFDQDDIDAATAGLQERIDDARNALDGVQR